MGTWNVGAFDNDEALDTLAMLENVNQEGLNAFLWVALDSKREEVVTMASSLIDIIHKGKQTKLPQCYTNTFIKKNILSVAEDNLKLRREAYQRVCYLIEQGNVAGWKNWTAREKELIKLRDSLADKLYENW